jgi:hypothetical protein
MKLRFLDSDIGRRLRRALSDQQEVMLVGGAVRDALLEQEPSNLDLWAPDPASVRAALGLEFGAPHAGMTRWDSFRWDHLPLPLRLDSGSRDLEANLRSRDFTVNAVALPLRAPVGRLIDPLHGALDATERRLRPINSNSCAVEPARWLRAGRLLSTRNLKPDPSLTSAAARGRRPLLHGVPTETRRLELWAALSCPHRTEGLRWLGESGLLAELVPAWGELAGRRDGDLGGRTAGAFSFEAVEALHLEHWAALLTPAVLEGTCRRLDAPVTAAPPRIGARGNTVSAAVPRMALGGWALTAVALWLHRLAPVADVSADLATLALHGLGAPMEETRAVTRLVLARNWLDRPVPLGRSGLEPHAAVADLCLREALFGAESPEFRAAATAANSVLPGFLAESA